MKDIIPASELNKVVRLVLDAVSNPNTRDAYGRALGGFTSWWDRSGRPPFSKAVVNQYKADVLEPSGLSPATINQRLSAIRKLAAEAADNMLIPQEVANGIARVSGVTSGGKKLGNWLSKEKAQELINAPDTSLIKGLRDRAILAVLVGAGLRRAEVARLTFEQIQQREGRWVIVDLVGKRNRKRSVPVPSWAKQAIDEWAEAAGINSGRIFRGVYRFGHRLQPESESITPQVIYDVVTEYAPPGIAPHDLRRTFAKLSRKGGAELTQIQLTLGHSNVKITQDYIGEDQDLTDAPCDRLGLSLDDG